MKRLVLGLGLVALAALSAACSGGSGASASAPAASAPAASAPAGDAIIVSAKDLKFSTASITAPADEAFQIVFDNQEAAPHNVAIKDASRCGQVQGRDRDLHEDHVRRSGPRRRRLRVLLRSPSGHEGHAHRRVASLAPRRSGPRPAAQAGVFFVWVSSEPACRAAGATTGDTCSKSWISPSATAPSWRSMARPSVPDLGGSWASSGPTAPARRRPCAASSASPGRIAARSAGRAQPVDRAARLRFGYMPEQRGLYPRMRVGEQLSYFAQQHGLSGRDANAAATRWLDRMGLGGPRQGQAGGALARQPAAGPAGRRPGARPGAARAGRAVLRPRPARDRHDDRRRQRAGEGRRRRGVQQPPARSRRGRVRGRGDHRPRADRRRRRDR